MGSAFLTNYARAFVAPKRAFEALLADPRHLALGAGYLAIPAALYTLMYQFLTLAHGAPSSFTPWLNIPKDEYYAYNRILVAPSMVICWILAAGVIQILSHLFKGKGTFEGTLAVIGLSIAVAMWATLGQDLVMSFLGAIRVIDARGARGGDELADHLADAHLDLHDPLPRLVPVLLFAKASAAAHQLRRLPAIALGVTGFAVFQAVFFVIQPVGAGKAGEGLRASRPRRPERSRLAARRAFARNGGPASGPGEGLASLCSWQWASLYRPWLQVAGATRTIPAREHTQAPRLRQEVARRLVPGGSSLQQDGIQLACFVIEEVELLNGDRYELDLDGSLYELEPLCSSSARRGVRRVLGVVHSLRRMSTSSATQGMPKGFQ
jgi:hypothetical protein